MIMFVGVMSTIYINLLNWKPLQAVLANILILTWENSKQSKLFELIKNNV